MTEVQRTLPLDTNQRQCLEQITYQVLSNGMHERYRAGMADRIASLRVIESRGGSFFESEGIGGIGQRTLRSDGHTASESLETALAAEGLYAFSMMLNMRHKRRARLSLIKVDAVTGGEIERSDYVCGIVDGSYIPTRYEPLKDFTNDHLVVAVSALRSQQSVGLNYITFGGLQKAAWLLGAENS